jgi:hypothetical protein
LRKTSRTRLVHDLAEEEEFHLMVLAVDAAEPLGRGVAGDELDLGEEGAELGHGPLHVVRQGLDLLPRDIRGR